MESLPQIGFALGLPRIASLLPSSLRANIGFVTLRGRHLRPSRDVIDVPTAAQTDLRFVENAEIDTGRIDAQWSGRLRHDRV